VDGESLSNTKLIKFFPTQRELKGLEARHGLKRMVIQENVLRIIAPALSNKVLPVPSAFSKNTIRVASLSKSITPHKSLYLLLGTRPWELIAKLITSQN
jgi:hypothetical protein